MDSGSAAQRYQSENQILLSDSPPPPIPFPPPAMSSELITSRANPLVKELRALSQKKIRAQRAEFLIQGIQLVLQAISSRAEIKLLVVASEMLTSELAREMVEQQARTGTRVIHVSREVFESFAEREHPTGIAAVIRIAARTLDELRVDSDAIFVALDQVSNPGNLGTILRTADAVNASGVILIGNATDPYAPTALNASRGAIFSVPVVQLDHAQMLLDWARSQNIRIVTTSDHAAKTLWNVDLRAPILFCLGNEGEGLPSELLVQGEAVKIPMYGAVDSLNLAVAASVLLYECVRRKTAHVTQNPTYGTNDD